MRARLALPWIVIVAIAAPLRCTLAVTDTEAQGLEGSTAVSFQQGVEGYTGTQDLSISSQYLADTGGRGATTRDGTQLTAWTISGAGGYVTKTLLRFDVSRVPADAVVVSATLQLTLDTWTAGARVDGGFLAAPWTYDATALGWTNRTMAAAWSSAGIGAGDVASSGGFAFAGLTATGAQTRTVALDAARVQAWVRDPAANHGVLLSNPGVGQVVRIAASENVNAAQRPRLTVTYRLPAADASVPDTGPDVPPSDAGVTPPPSGSFADGVTVRLQRVFDGATVLSFGLPLPRGAVASASTIRVTTPDGAPLAANVRELLPVLDAAGARVGAQAVLVQLPASAMTGPTLDVRVVWRGATAAPGSSTVAFTSDGVSADSPDQVTTATRTIASSGGVNRLVESARTTRTLFTGREARAVATYPEGYLAATGILGQQVTAPQAASPRFAGLQFFSANLATFARGARYDTGYAVSPESVVDPVANYEGWLYDRCATFLTVYAHHGDAGALRHGLRSCAWYARHITLTGANAGIFDGRPEPDLKYSHLRGLYAYYALTGDEAALAAGRAIAELWLRDATFVAPYRAGRLRSREALWTERLLGTALEGLYYGHRLTGEATYLTAVREVFATAYRHITGDAATLAALNPGVGPFPPQDCWIHSAYQHAEGDHAEPWCSSWMSELTLDALLRYQDQTGDARVDEVFVRLARFVRDVGSNYFRSDATGPRGDTFLQPAVCFNPADTTNPRVLAPLYGAGRDAAGVRRTFGEWDDFEHCADATALTAAALRALRRTGGYDRNPVGPFASEGAALLAVHHEFAACARYAFANQVRPRRDPAAWTSAQLAAGLSDPAAFVRDNKIGWPVANISPQRKLSWWFNVAMLQFGLLDDAGITVPALTPGRIQPAGCP